MAVFLQAGTLLANHAESVPGWRLHHPPAADLFDTACAQGFQSLYFGFDIGRFDIQMHAAGMVHRLQQNARLPFIGDQLPVMRIHRILQAPAIVPQRRRPEVCGGIEIVDLAIDDDLREPAAVHEQAPRI